MRAHAKAMHSAECGEYKVQFMQRRRRCAFQKIVARFAFLNLPVSDDELSLNELRWCITD